MRSFRCVKLSIFGIFHRHLMFMNFRKTALLVLFSFLLTIIPLPTQWSLTPIVPQTNAETINGVGSALLYSQKDGVKEYTSPIIEPQFPFQAVGVRWEGDTDVEFEFRIKTTQGWSGWRHTHIDWDLSQEGSINEGELLFTREGHALQYRVELASENGNYPSLEHFQINYIQTAGTSFRFEHAANAADVMILSRAAWGADENLRFRDGWDAEREVYCKKAPWACRPLSEEKLKELRDKQAEIERTYPEETKIVRTVRYENDKELVWPEEHMAKVHKLVAHHTARSFVEDEEEGNENENENADNKPLTAAEYQSFIRAMYYYHTVVRGWGDIGYNYVIDPLGNVYRGRAGGDTVTAAHVAWNNKGSMGVAVMGNYEEDEFPALAEQATVDILAYLAKKHRLSPEGSSSFRGNVYPNIVGHKDLAATACPGKYFYEQLPDIRAQVSRELRGNNNITVPILGDVHDANNEYSAEYVSTNISSIVVPPNSAKRVRLRFKNVGTKVWNEDTSLTACCSVDPTLNIKQFSFKNHDIAARMEQEQVRPGEVADFVITARAGYIERMNLVNFMPLINGQWKVQSVLIPVEVETPDYSYEFVSSKYPKNRLFFSEKTEGEVTLKNTGNVKWVSYGESAISLRPIRPASRTTEFHPTDPFCPWNFTRT